MHQSTSTGAITTAQFVRPIAVYALLAYAISWAWFAPLVVTGGIIRAGQGWPTHLPALLGPIVAAFIATAVWWGRRGVRDLVRRMLLVRVPLRWWAFALSPLMVLGAVLVVDNVTGHAAPAAADFASFSGVSSRLGVVGVVLVILVVNGFGEETGWRGFALPHLQERYTPLTSTLILSAMWVVWHAPMFVVVDTFRSFTAPIVVGWVIGLFCGAVVLSWLYNRSGGSILLVAIWHTTYNLISGTDAATGLLAAVSTTLVIVLAVVLVVLEIRSRRAGRATVLGPRAEVRAS